MLRTGGDAWPFGAGAPSGGKIKRKTITYLLVVYFAPHRGGTWPFGAGAPSGGKIKCNKTAYLLVVYLAPHRG